MSTDDFFRAEELVRRGDLNAAAQLFRKVVDANSEHVAAWRALSNVLAELGDRDGAGEASERANAVEAEHVSEVGASLLFHGDGLRAQSFFEKALELDADCVSAHWLMGEVFVRRGERDTALGHYRRCAEIAPDASGPGYMIAALGGDASPDRAPDAYVTAFFDWYADHFDSHLTDRLNYTGPKQVADVLATVRPEGLGRVLDLGCGTGLGGVALDGRFESLTGVDLSAAMLERARAIGLYDELVQGELLEILNDRADAAFDTVIAVDVLVYVGALEDLLAQVRRVLVDEGVFVASFEEGVDGDGWELAASGRYRHAADYIRRAGLDAGFGGVTVNRVSLREEYGDPVAGLLAIFEGPK